MRKTFRFITAMLAIFCCASMSAQDGHVTTDRSWDFTKGKNHASQVTDCEWWSASSKGRYALAKALSDQELPSNTGAPLSGLDGVYFTVGSGAVYGISQNFCFQNGSMTVRIPGCGVNDEITVDFTGAGGDATVSSDNLSAQLLMPSSISKQCDDSKAVAKVTADGDLVLKMSCGKGFRLYGISVKPYVPKERHFTDISIDFTTNPFTVTKPETGILPEGVAVAGTWHDAVNGYESPSVTVPVDGSVKVSIGNSPLNTEPVTISVGDRILATLPCSGDAGTATVWTYNSDDDAILTVAGMQYLPALDVAACDYVPDVTVTYYNTDGNAIGTDKMPGGATLYYKYSAADVTVPAGEAFRGWFASTKSTAEKVAEGTVVETDLNLYARATKMETPAAATRFAYDFTKPSFYAEDHEALEMKGEYKGTHGWLVPKGETIRVNVTGKCYLSLACCANSAESVAAVSDETGRNVGEFQMKASSDGAVQTLRYEGEPGWLSLTFPEEAFLHSLTASNVIDFVTFDENSGYYTVAAGDGPGFLMTLSEACKNNGSKIYLPNGTYDLGTTVLTPVTGKDISIVGESMKGTVILNYPPLDAEGISQTATLLNRSENLYLQDLTLRNAMTFDGKAAAGRAVCLQDKGKNTICKNVSLESYQDTYYSNNASAYFYFEDGEIHGVVDYVCGGGDVYFNRVKFVNEAVKNSTIAAPNGGKKFGYVMNGCTIETLCSQFNFGRSWGTYSGLAWLNTTVNQPSKLVSSRFTTAGMNCAADRFVEYNTMDASGNRISPDSNSLTFTHSSGNKSYETILSAEEAAEYAIEKVFPDWDPEAIASQALFQPEEDTADNVYLVDGKIWAGKLPEGSHKVRKANSRGGFGPEVEAILSGLRETVSADEISREAYGLNGLRTDAQESGIVIERIVTADGKTKSRKTIASRLRRR